MGAAHSKRCTKIYDPGNILRIFEERNTYSDKPCSRLELQRAQENAPKQRSSRRNNPVQIAIRNDVIIENIYIMGKIRLLLLLVLTIPCIARGQITIRQTAIVEKAVLRPERFDSLENIVPTERDKTYNLKKLPRTGGLFHSRRATGPSKSPRRRAPPCGRAKNTG